MRTELPVDKFQQLSTPFYFYDMELLKTTVTHYTAQLKKYGYKGHYALKANNNKRIIDLMCEAGLGADCVSGNEVAYALKNGFAPKEVVFSGVGKSDKEIKLALENRIFSFNCESIPEIEVIDGLAQSMNCVADITLRLNPNIDPHTHRYITTGLEKDKFGISPWMFELALDAINNFNHINLIGLHFHIGSQITDMEVFRLLCARVNELQHWFAEHGVQVPHINLGGGLGVNYHEPDNYPMPDFENFFALVNKYLEVRAGQTVHFEPGRALVAQSGTLITRVLYIKRGIDKLFAVVDAGMTDLIRPALYEAHHAIQNLTSGSEEQLYDVVGPICESSDCFAHYVPLPKTQRGDLIAIRSAGAYGETMASSYNMRDLPAHYYSDEL